MGTEGHHQGIHPIDPKHCLILMYKNIAREKNDAI
jgi:hypothetical protein